MQILFPDILRQAHFVEEFLSYKIHHPSTNAVNEHQPETSSFPMDDEELREQLEQHHAMSFGWALSCCSANPGEAEDILQMVYQKILQGRARYDGHSAFKTWLFAVIRNTAASERRRHWIRNLRLGSFQREHENDYQPADKGESMDAAERVELFRKKMGQLPRRQREVLHLVFYQNLTIEASAKAMGVSLGSARTHYERAKKHLGELLKQTNHDY